MIAIIEMLRRKLISILFTEPEKQMLSVAIYDRQRLLSKLAIEDKTTDYYAAKDEIKAYGVIVKVIDCYWD